MAQRDNAVSLLPRKWAYLVRFFVGSTGNVGCSIRDIMSGDGWIVADATEARTALDVIESTRPSRSLEHNTVNDE